MEYKPLELTNDITFQRMFGKIGNENITKGFLEKILGIKIDELTLDTNKRLIGRKRDNRIGRVDVKAKLSNGTKVIIEMQVDKYEYMTKRMLYYWAENYVADLYKGHYYDELKKTICILIYEGKMDETEGIKEYHTKWKLLEENHPRKVFTDDIEIHVIELSKFKEDGESRPEDNWIRLLKAKGADDMKKVSEEVEEEIQEALKELERMEGDPKLREEYEALEYEIREKGSRIRAALQEGIKQGIKQGMKQGMNEGAREKEEKIIQTMNKNGMNVDDICKFTNLSKEEVEKFISKTSNQEKENAK